MGAGRKPTYPLADVKRHIAAGTFSITDEALDGASELRFDRLDVEACIQGLDETNFYKTMPSERKPDLMQDVYRVRYHGQRIYLKLQVYTWYLKVVQFKEE